MTRIAKQKKKVSSKIEPGEDATPWSEMIQITDTISSNPIVENDSGSIKLNKNKKKKRQKKRNKILIITMMLNVKLI